jgi:hypothetical protein
MAITTVQQAIAEINATNLTDGQQIKQLLADLSTFLGSGGTLTPQAPVTAITNTNGVAAGTSIVEAANAAASDANFSLLVTKVNSILTALVAAGVMT